MDMQKTYSKPQNIVDYLTINVWGRLKNYAKRYRRSYYQLLSL